MKQKIIVLNSDEINRYGYKISVKALQTCVDQKWNIIMPSFISHDWHRHSGCSTQILSLYLEPGIARLTGILYISENKEEDELLLSLAKKYIEKEIADNTEPYVKEIKFKIGAHLTGKEKYFHPGCAAIFEEGLAQRVFPSIFREKDKDGLIPLKLLKSKAPGVFEIDGLLLFAHPYFRRSLSRLNTMNEPFFRIIEKMSEQRCDIKIALDEDLIGLASTFKQSMELEYWWGPKFSDDLAKIPKGVTVHKADERMLFFHGVSKTDFWWYLQDNKCTFECEEIKDIPSRGISDEKFGCRFVHSLIAPAVGTEIHVDGAVRMYDEAGMIERIDTTINKAGRNTEYTKLWRVDGSIGISEWKELITHYYRDNKLIGEYLGAQKELTIEQTSSATQVPRKQRPLIDLKEGQGIRISVSCHSIEKDSYSGRHIKPFDYISENSSNDKKYYIEAETIELIKILRVEGEKVSLPADITYLAYEDMITNLPVIEHIGLDATSMAMTTQKAIHKLINAWVNRGEDRIMSFTIGIQFSDKLIYFSFAGHIKDMNLWLSSSAPFLPMNEAQVSEWCEQASDIISKIFPKANDNPSVFSLLKETGIVHFGRYFLNPNDYRLIHSDICKPSVKLRLTKEHKFFEQIDSGELKIAPAFVIKGSICSKCHGSYLTCNCIKYLEPDVCEIVGTDSYMIGIFVTNRTA